MLLLLLLLFPGSIKINHGTASVTCSQTTFPSTRTPKPNSWGCGRRHQSVCAVSSPSYHYKFPVSISPVIAQQKHMADAAFSWRFLGVSCSQCRLLPPSPSRDNFRLPSSEIGLKIETANILICRLMCIKNVVCIVFFWLRLYAGQTSPTRDG